MKEELIQLKLERFQQKQVLLSGNPIIVENRVETQSYKPIPTQSNQQKIVRHSREIKLFPDLKRGTSGYGSVVSQWFGRYLKNLGLKKKGKNFHSFRYTVVNHLISKQVYEPFIKELVGYSHGTMTMDVYGGKKPLKVLLNARVVKLDYQIEGEKSEYKK